METAVLNVRDAYVKLKSLGGGQGLSPSPKPRSITPFRKGWCLYENGNIKLEKATKEDKRQGTKTNALPGRYRSRPRFVTRKDLPDKRQAAGQRGLY
jgi:hypothetical protein